MSGAGSDGRAGFLRNVGAKLLMVCILIVAAISLSWRGLTPSNLEQAGDMVKVVIGYEVLAFRTVGTELGRLIGILQRNVKITQPQNGCIRNACPQHPANGQTANEG